MIFLTHPSKMDKINFLDISEKMKITIKKDHFNMMVPTFIFCLICALIMGCGSKNASTGVAQLNHNSQQITADDTSSNTLQPLGSDDSLSNSSSADENISEQTDEEIATSFAECLRKEGMNVPDPELNADGTVNMTAFRQSLINHPNFNFQNPNTRQSMQKCVPLLQNASFAGQRSQEDEIELQDNLLEIAQCLRDAGIEVKDPDFSGGRRHGFQSMLGGLNLDRESLQEAMAQCSEAVFGNDNPRGAGRPPGR